MIVRKIESFPFSSLYEVDRDWKILFCMRGGIELGLTCKEEGMYKCRECEEEGTSLRDLCLHGDEEEEEEAAFQRILSWVEQEKK